MQRGSLFLKYKLHHLLFWVLLAGSWYYFRYQDFGTTALAFRMIGIKVIDLALLVYITNYVLIPRLLYKKKYVFIRHLVCFSHSGFQHIENVH
ncbi:MAG: hypothetical protein WDO19_29190 [Bacteroidota bacterium]